MGATRVRRDVRGPAGRCGRGRARRTGRPRAGGGGGGFGCLQQEPLRLGGRVLSRSHWPPQSPKQGNGRTLRIIAGRASRRGREPGNPGGQPHNVIFMAISQRQLIPRAEQESVARRAVRRTGARPAGARGPGGRPVGRVPGAPPDRPRTAGDGAERTNICPARGGRRGSRARGGQGKATSLTSSSTLVRPLNSFRVGSTARSIVVPGARRASSAAQPKAMHLIEVSPWRTVS